MAKRLSESYSPEIPTIKGPLFAETPQNTPDKKAAQTSNKNTEQVPKSPEKNSKKSGREAIDRQSAAANDFND